MNENEVKFMVYWKNEVLPFRNSINTGMINTASGYLGTPYNAGCSSCLHNSAVEINNLYNRMIPAYNEYLKKQSEEAEIKAKEQEIKAQEAVITKKKSTK